MPAHVDSAGLNKRYQDANPVVSKLSGVVPGAGHTVLNDEGRQWTVERVQAFLEEIAA